jgi:mannose-6-phosphate isomerase-like protein (cupin superfamily)
LSRRAPTVFDMSPSIVNVSAAANKTDHPFTIVPLATVADLSISLYVCQGQVNWHRHLDEDELFLVHEGVVTLDTERGRMTLHSEELAVVPKGVGHRSGSQLRSVVLLIRPTVLTNRKNGHRHGRTDTDPPLEKVRLARVQTTMPAPYHGMAVARVEDFDLVLIGAEGFGPPEVAPDYGAWWLAVRGEVGIETGDGAGVRLEAGDLTVVPTGSHYRLSAAQPSLLLTLARAPAGSS